MQHERKHGPADMGELPRAEIEARLCFCRRSRVGRISLARRYTPDS